jgi:hypothetical protein
MQNCLFVLALFLVQMSTTSAQNKTVFPETAQLLTVDSVSVKANDILKSGKPTMLVLWNSMMRPAIAELDSLHKVYPLWKEQYGVEIIALAWEYPKAPGNLKKFLAKRSQWTFAMYRDPLTDFGGALGATSMPVTYFIDKEGKMVHKMTGFDAAEIAKYEEKLKELTGK